MSCPPSVCHNKDDATPLEGGSSLKNMACRACSRTHLCSHPLSASQCTGSPASSTQACMHTHITCIPHKYKHHTFNTPMHTQTPHTPTHTMQTHPNAHTSHKISTTHVPHIPQTLNTYPRHTHTKYTHNTQHTKCPLHTHTLNTRSTYTA